MTERLKSVMLIFAEDGGLRLRVAYQTPNGAPPGSARRRKEVERLATRGLREALEALASGQVEMAAEAGFERREDWLEVSRKR